MRPTGITPDEEYALEVQRQGPSELEALTATLRRHRLGIEARPQRLGQAIRRDAVATDEIERRYPMEKGHAE